MCSELFSVNFVIMTTLCLYEYKYSFSCCHIYDLVLICKKLKVWHFHIWYNTRNVKYLKTCSLSIIGDRETCGNNSQNTLLSVFWGNFLFNWSPKHHDSPKLGWDVAEINTIKLTDQWSHTSCILSAALPRLLVSRDLEIQRAVGQIRLPNRVLLSDRKYIKFFPY